MVVIYSSETSVGIFGIDGWTDLAEAKRGTSAAVNTVLEASGSVKRSCTTGSFCIRTQLRVLVMLQLAGVTRCYRAWRKMQLYIGTAESTASRRR